MIPNYSISCHLQNSEIIMMNIIWLFSIKNDWNVLSKIINYKLYSCVCAEKSVFAERKKDKIQLTTASVVAANRVQPGWLFFSSSLVLSQLLSRSNNPLFTGRRRHTAIPKSSSTITRVCCHPRRREVCTTTSKFARSGRTKTLRLASHRIFL